MPLGFKFKGQRCQDFGIIMRSKNRPILPAVRQQYEEIQGKHGSIDFSDDTLDDKIIEVDCTFIERSIPDLRNKARQIAAWLYGKGELVFDDEPDLYYVGRLVNQIDLEQMVCLGRFTLQFRCHPLAQAVEFVADIYLDSDITLYRNLRLDGDYYSFTVTSPTTVEVNNWGTAPVIDLVIKVTGSFTNLTLATGGKTLLYNEALQSKTLTIDCGKYQAHIDGVSKLNKISGDFLELASGINQITISGTGLNCTVSFVFKTEFY